MAEEQRSVVAIESTPLEYWLATTDARDLGRIDQEKAKVPEKSNFEILKQLSVAFPMGMAAQGGV